MTFEEKGAYIELLMLQFKQRSYDLPSNRSSDSSTLVQATDKFKVMKRDIL